MILRPVWRFSDLPELSHLDPQDRRALLASLGSHRALARIYFVAGLVGFFAAMLSGGLLSRGLLSTPWSYAIGTGAGFLAAAAFLQIAMFRTRIRIRLEIMDQCRGEQTPSCLRCGYDLRGTPRSSHCPECGGPVISGQGSGIRD